MVKLAGSCHCGAVRFSLSSHTPQPYMHCYCSICRKTTGAGGSAVNIMGDAEMLKVEGEQHMSVYRARLDDGTLSEARRHFCKHCGSALYLSDPRWPAWVYPMASAIDTPLPAPAERCHIMLGSKPAWVSVPAGAGEQHFDEYPVQSIEDWHKSRALYGS